MSKKLVIIGLCSLLPPLTLVAQKQADKQDSVRSLQELVVSTRQILGSKLQAQNRTGSAYYLSPLEIKKLGYTDINRLLHSVPGVNIYEEDGFGLRPNISLRGTKAERSERITIMEDGILASPAPYSAPAAYYFPNSARMYAVEVLKGSSQVQYGPFTTGGAINLVSTPIPERFALNFNGSWGTYNTAKAHLTLGNNHKYFGYLVEYLRFQSDGFKPLTDGTKKGLMRNDVMAKFRANTDPLADTRHSIELKAGYADEHSDETYVGLTESDFALTPFERYLGSQMDNIKTRHIQLSASYLLQMDAFKLTAQIYHNYFHRNWYKLNDIQLGSDRATRRSIGDVLADEEASKRYLDILRGTIDYQDESLIVRANNRTYYSSGVQARAEQRLRLGSAYLTVEAGLRYHTDSEDRYQWDDSYSIVGGRMKLFYAGWHGSQSNRILSANAWAGHILSKLNYQWLTLTAGIRYEDIDLLRKDYGKLDLQRTGMRRVETPNRASAFIPSAGVNVRLAKWNTVFLGIHKGFAPPGVSDVPKVIVGREYVVPAGWEQQKPESSINMELGTRFAHGELRAEVIGFYNDYSNMLGSDLAATGGLGTLDQFNIGKARVYGLEALLSYQLLPKKWQVKMPMQLSYTYTDTEMLNAFVSNSWGKVDVGDRIPYIYKHALNAQLSLEHRWATLSINTRYNSDMRTAPGQGTIAKRQLIPAHLIVDASLSIHLSKSISLRANAINLTNKTYLVSRHPSGLRAGHPFGIYGGLSVKL